MHYLQFIAAAVSFGNNMNIKHTKIPIFFVTSKPRLMLLILCCWTFCLRNILFFGSPICSFVFDDCLLFSSMIISLLGVANLFLSSKLNSFRVVTSIHSSWDRGQYNEALFIIYKQDKTCYTNNYNNFLVSRMKLVRVTTTMTVKQNGLTVRVNDLWYVENITHIVWYPTLSVQTYRKSKLCMIIRNTSYYTNKQT